MIGLLKCCSFQSSSSSVCPNLILIRMIERVNITFPKFFIFNSGNFVAYTRHYCYVTNTYYISMNETIPTLSNSHIRRRRSIYYYQWLPILLAFQSLLFLIPRLIWSSFSPRCGINIQHFLSPKYDYRTSRYRVHHITAMLNLLARAKHHDFDRMTSHDPTGSLNSNSFSSKHSFPFKFLNIFCFPLIFFNANAFHGYYLVNLFLIVKILFLINSSLQLFLLNTLLTKNSIFYGLEVFENFLRGEYVVGTRIFPLSVYCDFNIVKIGQPTLYTVKRKEFFFGKNVVATFLGSMFITNECI